MKMNSKMISLTLFDEHTSFEREEGLFRRMFSFSTTPFLRQFDLQKIFQPFTTKLRAEKKSKLIKT